MACDSFHFFFSNILLSDSTEIDKNETIGSIECASSSITIDNKAGELARPDFLAGDIVWTKLRGYPAWPSRIERIYGEKNQMAEVWWFNDYRRSKVYKSQLQSFLRNFKANSNAFKHHIGLETAAKEAMMYIGSKFNNLY